MKTRRTKPEAGTAEELSEVLRCADAALAEGVAAGRYALVIDPHDPSQDRVFPSPNFSRSA